MSRKRSNGGCNSAVETVEQGSSEITNPTRPRQEVEDLAYRRWVERGCPQGSAEDDWYAAERELKREHEDS